MPDRTTTAAYFEQVGPANTDKALALAKARADELDVQHVVVATSTGRTAALAAEMMPDRHIVAVTHSTGFKAPNANELLDEYAERIRAAGGSILTCQHALGGVGRAIRRKLGTYQIDEIIAFTLRLMCQGTKVCCEVTVMAADAGLIASGEEVIAIGGTGQGADTAAVILAANAQDFFDMRLLELICKPRCWR